MMEEKKTIFDFVSGAFATFGIIIVIFMILTLAVGDAAVGYSSFFEFGRRALSINTLFQLLALSLVIRACRELLLTDRWIRRMSMLIRNTLFFLTITIVIVLFVILCEWFPLSDMTAWTGFLISFALCSSIGVALSRIMEKAENRKMDQALERYKSGR